MPVIFCACTLPLTCQIYSYSAPVGVFDFVPDKPYLVIFLAVFYLDVGGIGECCLVIFFFDRQPPVGIFAIVFDDCIFTVSADNSCGGICVYPAFAIGEFCISFYIFEIFTDFKSFQIISISEHNTHICYLTCIKVA